MYACFEPRRERPICGLQLFFRSLLQTFPFFARLLQICCPKEPAFASYSVDRTLKGRLWRRGIMMI
jgi:hypothetical protein